MKLRFRHNSVRLRLSQGEVARLRDVGSVEESIEFGHGQHFAFRISSEGNPQALTAGYRNGELAIAVPKQMVSDWADSSQVGMQMEQPVNGGQPLRVLVEKDFKCLDPADAEENVDAFPNPLETGAC